MVVFIHGNECPNLEQHKAVHAELGGLLSLVGEADTGDSTGSGAASGGSSQGHLHRHQG